MRLRDVLAGCQVVSATGNLDIEILGIAYDSRRVSPGFVFAAIRGLRTDGNQFVPQAMTSGAVAVVSELPPPAKSQTAWIQVEDDRGALAMMSAQFFGRPTATLHTIGITGTNGKTTTAWLVESILKAAGLPAALFGTVEYRGPGFEFAAERTTPEAPDLEALFQRVVDGGWKYAVMEVSSHAIDLKRVEGLRYEVAVFTNLSRDHLDFHPDLRAYFLAKKRLFMGLDGVIPRHMVLNMDDPHFEELKAIAPDRVISYGMDPESDIHPTVHHFGWNGTDATFKTPLGLFDVHSSLPGKPNLYNIAAAIGVGVALGIPAGSLQAGIERLSSVPGRFEAIPSSEPFKVIVDYAHTDDALARLLETVREITPGKVIVVFGCAGERDRTKRPLMGEAAARWSDLAVVTSDNPRGEDPQAIIGEVEAGLRGANYRSISDRREAIRFALENAKPGDTVVVAGKGHETYQVIGSRSLAFDDRIVVQELLDELASGRSH